MISDQGHLNMNHQQPKLINSFFIQNQKIFIVFKWWYFFKRIYHQLSFRCHDERPIMVTAVHIANSLAQQFVLQVLQALGSIFGKTNLGNEPGDQVNGVVVRHIKKLFTHRVKLITFKIFQQWFFHSVADVFSRYL